MLGGLAGLAGVCEERPPLEILVESQVREA